MRCSAQGGGSRAPKRPPSRVEARVAVGRRLRPAETPPERPIDPVIGGEACLLLQLPTRIEPAHHASAVAPVRDLFGRRSVLAPETIDLAAAQRPPAARFIELRQLGQALGARRAQPPVRQDGAALTVVEPLDEEMARAVTLAQAGRARGHAALAQRLAARI